MEELTMHPARSMKMNTNKSLKTRYERNTKHKKKPVKWRWSMRRMADAMSEIRKARKKHAYSTTDPGVENFNSLLDQWRILKHFSQSMYLYFSSVERRVTEFYHNMNGRRYLVWFKWIIFITISREVMVCKMPKEVYGLWNRMWIATQRLDVQTKSILRNVPILNH